LGKKDDGSVSGILNRDPNLHKNKTPDPDPYKGLCRSKTMLQIFNFLNFHVQNGTGTVKLGNFEFVG